MLQPGAKNWVDKYFSLIEEGRLSIDTKKLSPVYDSNEVAFLHHTFFESGIIFGYPVDFIFYKDEKNIKKWTSNEKTVLLLFECLLLVYITTHKKHDSEDFVRQLLDFYRQSKSKNILSLVGNLFKEKEETKLEHILKNRTHIKKNISNRLWASYFENSLIYIDILGFRLFLAQKESFTDVYSNYVLGALQTVSAMAAADKKIDETERYIVSIFLEVAEIREKEQFIERLDAFDFSISDVKITKDADELYKLYLLDMAVLTLSSNLDLADGESVFLKDFCRHLSIPKKKLDEVLFTVQRFLLKNNNQVAFLQEKSTYEHLSNNFSKRWIKILGRNKDKLVEELKESKELINLVNKSFTEELTDKEKEKVKKQFKDILKSVPALAVFMLPGGIILLPLILKIVPDLIPSSFKQNERTEK